ncbi:hypothetical protein C491_14067 [Natronococcus amylolyticus DSM 10524]|uniref:Uncharacterized protein n=1 Tax=Natronococcus amylolyticus DSM 10524 TaxID=1227497 RepID=L9X3Q3_9EURY|nr:hypothetical protein C491_14067 [Natronococcus amylolyticus DSM 10524]
MSKGTSVGPFEEPFRSRSFVSAAAAPVPTVTPRLTSRRFRHSLEDADSIRFVTFVFAAGIGGQDEPNSD